MLTESQSVTGSEATHLPTNSERPMPSDELTGLPYPILPTYISPTTPRGYDENYHHHFYYRRDPDLEGGIKTSQVLRNPENIPYDVISGLAVRMSRGQMLPVGTHDLLHKRFGAGPQLPRTQDAKFYTAVLACSGVISRYALDLTKPNGQELVVMSSEQFSYMSSPGTLQTEKQSIDRPSHHRRAVIGSFFLRYAVARDLTHITERVIDEFLNTQSRARKTELGGLILREAIYQSIEPMKSQYSELHRLGFVSGAHQDLRVNVSKFIKTRPIAHIESELISGLDKSYTTAA